LKDENWFMQYLKDPAYFAELSGTFTLSNSFDNIFFFLQYSIVS